MNGFQNPLDLAARDTPVGRKLLGLGRPATGDLGQNVVAKKLSRRAVDSPGELLAPREEFAHDGELPAVKPADAFHLPPLLCRRFLIPDRLLHSRRELLRRPFRALEALESLRQLPP